MYKVQWTMEIDEGATPIEAAVAAFFHMQRRHTTANVFDVIDEHGDTGHVDLQELLESDPDTEALMEAHDQRERVYYVLAVIGEGLPVTQGPFQTDEERDACARAIATDLGARLSSLFYVELSPMNFEVFRFPRLTQTPSVRFVEILTRPGRWTRPVGVRASPGRF